LSYKQNTTKTTKEYLPYPRRLKEKKTRRTFLGTHKITKQKAENKILSF